MNAVATAENSMVEQERIARLESDVSELKSDVKVINARLSESIIANAKEFGELKMGLEKGIGMLRTEIEKTRTEAEKHRAETEKGFGTLRAEVEKNRVETEKSFGVLRAEAEKNRAETEKSFGVLRAETEKSFGVLRAETEKGLGVLRAETEKGLGSLKASIESAKLWMLVTGVGSVILVTFVTFLGHALKLF